MTTVHCVPAFDDNYIWLIQAEGSRRVVAVDPGDEEPVRAALARTGLELAAILITHHHGDHTGGVRDLLAQFPVPVYGPAHEPIATLSDPVREGDRLVLDGGRLSFQVLDTPGHTRGHVSYVGHGALFCGDTLFTGGCGRLFEGSPEQMHASLEKIAALPDATRVYCAHEYTLANLKFARIAEPDNDALRQREEDALRRRAANQPTVPSTLALERATNPFLRSTVPALVESASRFAGRPLRDAAEVFAVVRHWKDTLD